MSYTLKTKHLIVGVILSLFLTFLGGWYFGHVKEKKASLMAQNSLKNELTRITVQLNDVEYSLTKTEQSLTTERELRKQDVIDKKTLKALNLKHVNEISKLKLRIDTLLEDVENSGGVITIHDTITLEPKNYIRLPFVVTKNDQWLSLKDSTDIKGKTFIALKMDMAVDAISGIDKTTKKPTLSLLSDNPYIQTIGIKSYKTDTFVPKRYGLSIYVGYGISKEGLSPQIGVGLGYSLIRF